MLREIRSFLPPNVKVNLFFFIPGMDWMMLLMNVFSGIAFVYWPAGVFIFVVYLLLFGIICQYIHVCRKSLPWLKFVPVIAKLPSLNTFIEVEINSIEGVYLKAKEAGLFQAAGVSGK